MQTDTKPTTIADVVLKASQDEREKFDAAKAAAATTDQKITFKAVRFDDNGDCGVIYGFGASVGVDKEGDEVERAALIGMAHDFAASKAKVFCANHDEGIPLEGALVENAVGTPILKSGRLLKPGEEIPADDPFVGMNLEKGSETFWFFGYRPNDPKVLEAARKGEIVGFSWAGNAQKASE